MLLNALLCQNHEEENAGGRRQWRARCWQAVVDGNKASQVVAGAHAAVLARFCTMLQQRRC